VALYARRTQYISLGAAILVTTLLSALLMAWLSQSTISTPIVRLAEVARRV
jgi:hypothetical protein